MNTLSRSLNRQIQALRNNPLVTLLLAATAACVLYLAYVHHAVPKAIAYICAMWVCMLVTDMLTINKPAPELPVRKPGRESVLVLSSLALGSMGMMLRFAWLDWAHTPGLLRLGVAAVMILFAFPIAVAIVLLAARYKLPQLGFRMAWPAIAGVAALGITAATAVLADPAGLTWQPAMEEAGSVGAFLFMGFISAALPEEFLRLVLQTRLGTWLNNKALGWYLACLLWAFLHFPKWYGEGGDMFEGIMGAIRIVPLGLMWSYMIHRTKSIYPSWLAHGLNLWGLQNF